jgi:hypothetical protein
VPVVLVLVLDPGRALRGGLVVGADAGAEGRALPSYAELVEALRWLAPTVDNSLSMAEDAGVDEEEIDEVRVSLNDYRPMLRRIGIELPDDPEWAKATSEIEHAGLKKEIERLREEER